MDRVRSGPGNAIRGQFGTEIDLLADAAGALCAGTWIALANRGSV